MYHFRLCLAALLALAVLPSTVLAETRPAPVAVAAGDGQRLDLSNGGGFHIDLPAPDPDRLLGMVRAYRATLAQREREVSRYLDENSLDGADALITAILPGGVIYAIFRQGSLDQARAELAEINAAMDELSRDLLRVLELSGRGLTVAQLQRQFELNPPGGE